MKNLFTAFYGEMPVNPEIRFFIRDKKILCWHWYWIEDAIKNPSINNWKDVMNKAKEEELNPDTLKALTNEVNLIAQWFDGYWSIDFCKGKDEIWYLIDMARGERSWHPVDCKLRGSQTINKEEI